MYKNGKLVTVSAVGDAKSEDKKELSRHLNSFLPRPTWKVYVGASCWPRAKKTACAYVTYQTHARGIKSVKEFRGRHRRRRL